MAIPLLPGWHIRAFTTDRVALDTRRAALERLRPTVLSQVWRADDARLQPTREPGRPGSEHL
ncbi:MAG: hypothetical protein ACC726_07485 [Chloroflexota bacterium]